MATSQHDWVDLSPQNSFKRLPQDISLQQIRGREDDLSHNGHDREPQETQSRQSPDYVPRSQRWTLRKMLSNFVFGYRSDPRDSSLFRVWWLEVLACALASFAFLSIIITLAVHQGRPLPQWPHHISVNALISVFVVIMKASMLYIIAEGMSQLKWMWYREPRLLANLARFENASQGPGAAISFLWSLPNRPAIGSIGAVIVAMAILIDPFVQQLVNYADCDKQSIHSRANVVRANVFGSTDAENAFDGTLIDTAMRGSMLSGLFEPNVSSIGLVPFDCPTGNCTFSDEYFSLGMCSECFQIDEYLNKTCSDESPHAYDGGLALCNYTLPTPVNLTANIASDNPSANADVFTAVVLFPDADSQMNVSYAGAPVPQIQMIGIKCVQTIEGNVGVCLNGGWKVTAASCTLNPCIRGYTSNVSIGALAEQTRSIYPLPLSNPSDQSDVSEGEVQCFEAVRVDCLPAGYLDASHIQVPPNADWIKLACDSLPSDLAPECLYSFEYWSYQTTWEYLDNIMNGNLSGLVGPLNVDGPVALQALYNYGNFTFETISERFDALAAAMTSRIRQSSISWQFTANSSNSDDGFYSYETNKVNQPAQGVAYKIETCINVKWAWIIVPAILVLLSLVFFVGLVIQAENHPRVRDWKSNPLPYLAAGLDQAARDHFQLTETAGEMDERAEALTVQLQRTESGWRFVTISDLDSVRVTSPAARHDSDEAKDQFLIRRKKVPASMSSQEGLVAGARPPSTSDGFDS